MLDDWCHVKPVLEPVFWAFLDTYMLRVWVFIWGILMSNWCMSIVFLWALITCLFVDILVDNCWLLELLLDHTLRHMLGHLWVSEFIMLCWFLNYFWSVLNIYLMWYNACLIDWFLLACLENALVQPFRVYFYLLFLIEISWGRSTLLIFTGHTMPQCLWFQLSFAHDVCLPILWPFLEYISWYYFLMLEWFIWLI